MEGKSMSGQEHIKNEEISYLEHVQDRVNAKRKKQFSRRTLLAAGWAVPIVLSVGLSPAAQAKSSRGHGLSRSHGRSRSYGRSRSHGRSRGYANRLKSWRWPWAR